MLRGRVSVLLVLSLLGSAFSVPTEWRVRRGYANNELDSRIGGGYKDLEAASSEHRKVRQEDEPKDNSISEKDASTETEPSKVNLSPSTEESKTSYPPPSPYNDDDDDDSDEDSDLNVTQPSGGGGSSIFSLLKLANALFPGSSSSNIRIRNVIKQLLIRYKDVLSIHRRPDNAANTKLMRRIDTSPNEIDDSYIADLKPPPFQKQEIEESFSDENDTESDEVSDENETESDEDTDEEDNDSEESAEDQDNAAEESVENNEKDKEKDKEKDSKSKQETSKGDDDDDDYSEEPEGDGQGGGILGILAGLSGGEDGSDLGSLLAAVGGIVANLSGDGVDINALIASGLGLFVGLLSEGEENPGAVIASYLLTSLDTLTGGGAENNGAFFGTFLSKLIKGTSAAPEGSSEENGNGMPMTDSVGFVTSFIMGLLGDMSKGSSGGSSHR